MSFYQPGQVVEVDRSRLGDAGGAGWAPALVVAVRVPAGPGGAGNAFAAAVYVVRVAGGDARGLVAEVDAAAHPPQAATLSDAAGGGAGWSSRWGVCWPWRCRRAPTNRPARVI